MSSLPVTTLARRSRRVVAALAVAVVLLGGCSGARKDPTKYGDTTRSNFLEGCVERGEDEGLDGAAAVCRCAYAGIVRDVSFAQFKKDNDALEKDPGPLPERYQVIIDRCADARSEPG
jgi:hypothetical protein